MPFSESHAGAACNFFELLLKHTQDEWYGQPFILSPWEEDATTQIFGTLDDDGRRLIEMAYMEVPKKAGKSEWVAGLVLYALVMDPNPGCQVYGVASATRQAMNIYRAACKMVEQSPILRKRLVIRRGTNRIVKKGDPDSFYAAVPADGDLGDGVNPSFVAADELHRWKTRKQIENWDVLSNGGITRRQTLTIAITTAGVQNESPIAWRLHEKTRKIREGIVQDPKFFGRIYGADKTDDPSAESTWIKANPSLKENGGFLDISKIREKYESHVAEGDLTAFKRYFLNMWDQKEDRAIDMVQWDACHGTWVAQGLLPNPGPAIIHGTLVEAPAVRPLPHDVLAHFAGRRCYAGVDLSMTTDFTAVAFLFPCDDDAYEVLPFFWMPDANIRKREVKDGMPYRQWADQGFLELCAGAVIDYRDVQARLEWGAQMFDLHEIGWDPANSRQISVAMVEKGFECFEVRQGYAHLNEPVKKILSLIVSGKFWHGNHPVLRFNASCCSLAHQHNSDNVMFAKPEREKSSARIDGMAAAADAMARALMHTDDAISYKRLKVVG